MADTMQFDLVSPEKSLASMKATAVQLPAAEGDMTAMPGHSPTITTLRPGVMIVAGGETSEVLEYAVTGGFAEITPNGTTVLAERAFERGPEAVAALTQALDDAKSAHESAEGPQKDVAAKLVADFAQLLERME